MKLLTRKFSVMHLAICLFIMTYFIVLAFLTPGLDSMTRLFPMIVLSAAIPIGILETLSVINKKVHDFLDETSLFGKKKTDEDDDDLDRGLEAKAIIWLLSYVALFFLIGPLFAMIVGPFVLMRYLGKVNWMTCFINVGITWVSVYLIFVKLVGARLPVGLFFGGIW